ncbi:hypothetical protein R69746_07727 [Paraburkholderia aspalathi]|uniref:hypothetical protein n=1 Tax=Paraburkholderia aspalathi TaxID=1324617 RepID=UPI001B233209|nr:hypothetical protein [Paraburkholderia aspalathi]MBK3843708.1 type II toxin-antitoxin system antitoxin, RelB/DinJ family [Paraburkholderia aspalathi]CAE6856144.1 hypothetical protein R75465_07422 [Paraburkholderia aspalathi]CAE6859175.1 hypothetical protein R69746_07727 [Paraburkholderia aspalathi]
MPISRVVHARVPGEIQDVGQDKAIPPEIFQPNTETLAAFAEIKRSGLKRHKTVDALFENLNADD